MGESIKICDPNDHIAEEGVMVQCTQVSCPDEIGPYKGGENNSWVLGNTLSRALWNKMTSIPYPISSLQILANLELIQV